MNQEREMFCGMRAFQHQIFGFGCGSTLSFKTLCSLEISSTTLKSNLCDCKMALELLTYRHTRDHVNVLASGKSQLHAQVLSPTSLPVCLLPQALNPPHLSSTSKKLCGEEEGKERC